MVVSNIRGTPRLHNAEARLATCVGHQRAGRLAIRASYRQRPGGTAVTSTPPEVRITRVVVINSTRVSWLSRVGHTSPGVLFAVLSPAYLGLAQESGRRGVSPKGTRHLLAVRSSASALRRLVLRTRLGLPPSV